MSLQSTMNSSAASAAAMTCSAWTARLVSRRIFHPSGARERNCSRYSACSSGSPPPNVTPPPEARKYRSSILTRSSSCAAVICSGAPSFSSLLLMHQRQCSGHPAPATRVVMPAPSMPMRSRASASRGYRGSFVIGNHAGELKLIRRDRGVFCRRRAV